MEATHHGPYMDIPSCFVEIGSSDAGWDLPYAGQLWSSVLASSFGLPLRCDEGPVTAGSTDPSIAPIPSMEEFTGNLLYDTDSVESGGVVVVGIGGGHYVPKMNDLVSYRIS